MLLKVGELAKRSGLTVRTLHHYDSIGLLRPSGRSDGGYRLYDRSDVARLHGIQALRALGLPLEDIGQLLDGAPGESGEGGLMRVLGRQLASLQEQIAQATTLRDRLLLVQAKFDAGEEPELDDWLATLQMMTTCSRWFDADEIRRIFANWREVEQQLQHLSAEIRVQMDRGVPADDPVLQPLAQRWMNLMHTWMQGDFGLMDRWGEMFRAEGSLHNRSTIDRPLADYIDAAVNLRLSLYFRYIDKDDLRRIGVVPAAEWRALVGAVKALIDAGVAPADPAAWPVARQWLDLKHRLTGGDAVLGEKLQRAYDAEPLLRAGAAMPPWARAFLVEASAAAPATA
ncbi:MerR family transcriptional regulator [Aquincola sp. S2]|uniref:MerR family transcriptional regulator n=1 Tax=Pseudaquabacterium terrae TaxID=2732868 RepID=A0ABX2EMM4_9BURK|nr:MerR family transcriptional regulator [Aquabacterium terrae]NRF69906.1 MerR family transcriptional regulator [Aquabacterium terrae]